MTDDNTPIIYNAEDVLKKEARGLGNADFGEVQEVSPEYIVTQKGTLVVDKFSPFYFTLPIVKLAR